MMGVWYTVWTFTLSLIEIAIGIDSVECDCDQQNDLDLSSERKLQAIRVDASLRWRGTKVV